MIEFHSINKMLEESFRQNWDRNALSNYQGVTLKYSQVATKIAMLHYMFKHCGLEKGDKVAICSRNQANWGVCFLAALTYGAVPVPILHEFKPDNIHYLVNHSDAKVFFVEDKIWDDLSESEMPAVKVFVQMNTMKYIYSQEQYMQDLRDTMVEDFSKIYPEGFSKDDIDYCEDKADELALINYTSGTSGFSKGVMLSRMNLYNNIRFAHEEAEPQMDNTSEMVSLLPSAHMYGLIFEFLFEMTIGAHVHFLNRMPSPKIIMSAFADIKPSVIIAVPLIIEKVYKSKVKPMIDRTKIWTKIPFVDQVIYNKFRSSLVEAFGGRFEEVILGGAAFNPEVDAFFHKIGFPYTVGYGMTECAPIITYSKWSKSKVGSCGKAVGGIELRIDSEDPANIPGEVQVHGLNVFMGYYKNPEATEASFTPDGWLKTGDMGVIDNEGYLFLRGRSKCMILGPSGQNIYPEELEAVINNRTYVIDSLVVEENNQLTALIYPDYRQAALDGMSEEQLNAKITSELPIINKALPGYAQIRKIEFMPEDFERTPKKSIKRYLYKR